MGKVTRQSVRAPQGQTLHMWMAIVTCCCMVLSVRTFLEAVLFRIGWQTITFRFFDSLYGVAVIRYALHGVSDERGLVEDIHKTLKPSAKLQIMDMCATREDHVFFYDEVHSCKTLGPPLESSILSKVIYEAEYECIAKSTDRVTG